jgi:glycosyltransferase involved in cell wall biosynthesis
MPASVLFVHNNFPAQFGDLAKALVGRGLKVAAFGQKRAPGLPEVPMLRYAIQRSSTEGIFTLAIRPEADLIRGEMTYRAAKRALSQGFTPDVIIGHSGWGETLFLDQVYPDARQIIFPEFYYRPNLDVGFDPEFPPPDDLSLLRLKAKNFGMTLSMIEADALVCPTEFQAATLPKIFKPLTRVIHEGVDTEAIRPGPAAPFVLDDGRVIEPGAPVITHVNRNLEAMRGMHIFARALPRLLAEVPDAHVLIIGRDGKSGYTGPPPEDLTWREYCTRGLDLDPHRVHFLGAVSHERMLEALRLSTAHVYYTYPFVLSWSVIEAMALGCYVIASDTPPVRDAVVDGENGRLLPFFDVEALSEALIAACREPAAQARLRKAARATAVEKFSAADGRDAWFRLLRELGIDLP